MDIGRRFCGRYSLFGDGLDLSSASIGGCRDRFYLH